MRNKFFKSVLIVLVMSGGFVACSKTKTDEMSKNENVAVQKYHCPMHPTYISDKPGECPICHMRLVPIKEDEMEDSAVPGYSSIHMSKEKQERSGIQTTTATIRPLTQLVRASGRVAYDPDLYNALVEHREVLKVNSQGDSNALLRASTLRLEQMGLSTDQIAALTKDSQDLKHLLTGGGDYVWVYADIYEYESGLVKRGQTLNVTSSAFPGQTFTGSVFAVDTILNPMTRTLRVRAKIPNTKGLLKPEMYVDAAIHVDLGRSLSIPQEALMDTGPRQIVFVETSPQHFEPRLVKAGQQGDGYVQIVDGLKEGEQVVRSANFLVDSESRLNSAVKMATEGGHHHGQ